MKKKTDLQTAFSTRQYMLSKDFEIYYYNDIEPYHVLSHAHDYYEFYFFLEGDVTLHIDQNQYRINPGDFVLIPPNTAHYPEFTDSHVPYRRIVLWISQDYCNRLLEASPDYIYIMQYVATTHNYLFSNDIITFNSIQALLFQLIDEIKNERFGKSAQISLQINQLILFLNRSIYNRYNSGRQKNEKELYMTICDYIDLHLDSDLSLDLLEREFYISKFHIAHAFKDNIGISLHQYITKKRLQACKDAIVSGQPIVSVYELFGFHDYSNFYRAFKKEFGMSPKEYQTLFSILRNPLASD